MQRVDLILLVAVALVVVGVHLAVGLAAALIAAGVAGIGYWVVLNLDDGDA